MSAHDHGHRGFSLGEWGRELVRVLLLAVPFFLAIRFVPGFIELLGNRVFLDCFAIALGLQAAIFRRWYSLRTFNRQQRLGYRGSRESLEAFCLWIGLAISLFGAVHLAFELLG